jgi:predicted enzyme related to lactoylglutathione lyase
MTTRTTEAPVGAPCWIDLSTSDPAKTDAFYGELFGWVGDEPNPEFGGYRNYRKDGKLVAGVMQAMEGAPDAWGVYLAAPDAEKIVANAPGVVSPAMDVGDLGTMALVTDPGGSLIGAWKAGAHKGFEVFGEPGTPGWFELHSKSYDADVAFYADTFGWPAFTAMDMPEFRYTTHGEGEAQLAGIVDSSVWPDDPSGWHLYFTVADADATVAKAVELGATVVEAPQDTPYGRLATLVDPNGARFKLQQP